MRRTGGAFAWPQKALLVTGRLEDRPGLDEVAEEVRQLTGRRPRVVLSAGISGTVTVVRDPRLAETEGYRLTVARGGIRVEARTDAGAFYGLQTLKALLRLHGRALPCCQIADGPVFARRGVYLDCSRGKVPTLETLKGLVRFLARLKVNELQLYVENVFTFARHPKIGRGFSPFTPEDLLDLQAYCARHHLRFVPSLASFGHMERILTLPEYRALGENPGYRGLPGGTTLCPTDPRSIRLMEDLYDEFLPLFMATDFNACCDETFGLGEGRSAAQAKSRGAARLYLDFILKLHALCEKHGKRMNLWADIVLNHPRHVRELPRDLVLLNWEYDPGGPNIAHCATLRAAGLDYLACPGVHAWLAHGTRLERSMQNIRSFTREAARHGASGILNTDWGDFGHRQPLASSLHGLAYGAAHAWSGGGAKVRDKTFTATFCLHVFGLRDPRLVRQIRVLGGVQPAVGRDLYWANGESLHGPRLLLRGIPKISPVWFHQAPDCIGQADPDGCRRALADLETCHWEGFDRPPADPFLRPAFDEYGLAADLDRLALRRILLGQRLRADRPVSRSELRELTDQTRRVRARFESNWLLRNRPSRLRDNLRLLDNAADEMRQI